MNACILPGVRIGAHAIVGAGAVVVHDVPDYAVVAGVPARLIRDRRGEQTDLAGKGTTKENHE
jgi:acetyltransferase-like isoleucine patch superfamily enzyme